MSDADSKMHIPSDGFGGVSPERKAAQALTSLVTFAAAKAVLAQMSGSGRGALGAYNAEGYRALEYALENESLRDADAWLLKLTKANNLVGVRIAETRLAYASTDFEWDKLKELTLDQLQTGNETTMRTAAAETFGRSIEKEE